MLVKNVNNVNDVQKYPVIFTGEDIREKKVIKKVSDLEGKLTQRESKKKSEEAVKKEPCTKIVKMQEENKALRDAQNILKSKIEKTEKEFEAERFEESKLIEALELVIEGGQVDLSKLKNCSYRKLVHDVSEALRKTSSEPGDSEKCSSSTGSSSDSPGIAHTSVSGLKSGSQEDCTVVKVRLCPAGVCVSEPDFHLVTTGPGSDLLSMASLQVNS